MLCGCGSGHRCGEPAAFLFEVHFAMFFLWGVIWNDVGPTEDPALHPYNGRLAWLKSYMSSWGHAVAQEVSRRLPTAAARVRSRGICGGQNSTGAGFFRVFQLLVPINPPTIPPGADANPHSVNKYLLLESDHVKHQNGDQKLLQNCKKVILTFMSPFDNAHSFPQ
jgi:hypothetical protein